MTNQTNPMTTADAKVNLVGMLIQAAREREAAARLPDCIDGAQRRLDEARDKVLAALEASPNSRTEAITDEMIEAVKKLSAGEEPTMPGLSAHFPEMEYHGGAQYTVKCDCGFKTRKPENYYVVKARWADHAMQAARPIDQQEAMEMCDACNGSGFGVADTYCGKCGGAGGYPIAPVQDDER